MHRVCAARYRKDQPHFQVDLFYAGGVITPGTHHVATPQQAQQLLRPELRPLLNFLMVAARSASEVADHLALPLARASYLLGKLCRGNVAFVERVDARHGRPIKRYRVSPRWFIPYEVTAAETLEAFWLAQIGPRMERISSLAAH